MVGFGISCAAAINAFIVGDIFVVALYLYGIFTKLHHYSFVWQTTIEFYINTARFYDPQRRAVYRNPFDEGWRKNLRRVLGEAPWHAQLWPNFTPPAAPKYAFAYDSVDGGGGGASCTEAGHGWEIV